MRRRRVIELAPAPAPASTSPTTAPASAPPRRTRRPKVEPVTGPSSPTADTPAVPPTLTFVRFCEDVIGVVFEAGQRVFYSVAADGVDPIDLPPEERETARELFGPVDRIPPEARKVIVAVKGADIGWTYFLALRMVHRCLTARVSDAAAGETRWCLCVAPDLELASTIVSYARGAVETTPLLAHMQVRSTTDSIVLERPDGHEVGIRTRAAAIGGRGGRGQRWIEAGLDELAFFRDRESGKVNDADVYSPIAARVRDGQVWLGSTPWAESGLLYDLHRANWGHPRTALAANLPTVAMRSDQHVLDNVRRETERDPDSAGREFGCEFLTAGAGQFFDDASLALCIDDDLSLPAVPGAGASMSAGADFGYTRNSSALAIVGTAGGLHRLVDLIEVKPSKGSPLKPSVVGARFRDELGEIGCESVALDAHYLESNREHLAPIRLIEAPGGQNGKAAVYVACRAAMREGKVRIPNHPRLVKQLRQVVSKPLPGGGLSISSPQWRTGEHGDVASAFVLAIWHAAKHANRSDWGATMRALARLDEEVYAERFEDGDDEGDGYGIDYWD